MSTPNPQRTLDWRGVIIANPTSFESPYGGTELGLFSLIKWELIPRRAILRAEEFSGVGYQVLENGEDAVVAAFLREYDADAFDTLFPESSSGDLTYTATDERHRGGLGGDRAVSLLLAPDATEVHPALFLDCAIGWIDETTSISHDLSEEWGIPVAFWGMPQALGRVYQYMLLERMTLTP
jgi:hypothetical protein